MDHSSPFGFPGRKHLRRGSAVTGVGSLWRNAVLHFSKPPIAKDSRPRREIAGDRPDKRRLKWTTLVHLVLGGKKTYVAGQRRK